MLFPSVFDKLHLYVIYLYFLAIIIYIYSPIIYKELKLIVCNRFISKYLT